MKLLIIIEADVSETIADTIRRNGFHLVRDGSSMRLAIENTPSVPRRKTRVEFLNDIDFEDVLAATKNVPAAI